MLDLEVVLDTHLLQTKIHATTGGRGIRVSSSNGQVVLSGEATDAVAAERAVAVARAVSPKAVVNAMNVADPRSRSCSRFVSSKRPATRAATWA